MSELVPADREHCQVWKYVPFGFGSVYRECGKKPSFIITAINEDGLKGSQSCCTDCRQEWVKKSGNPNVDDSWAWEEI
jgi:hypothetical protein